MYSSDYISGKKNKVVQPLLTLPIKNTKSLKQYVLSVPIIQKLDVLVVIILLIVSQD